MCKAGACMDPQWECIPEGLEQHIYENAHSPMEDCITGQWRSNIKVKMQVYSLVSSTKHHSPNFTQITPWSQDLFIYKPSQLPREHTVRLPFRCTELFKHTSLHCPTRYPLPPGSTECTCEQSALPRSTTSEHILSTAVA